MEFIHHHILKTAERFPEKDAIICDGRRVSYADLVARMTLVADMIRQEGVTPGDRVMILLSEKTSFLVAVYATMQAGAIAVPVSDTMAAGDLLSIAKDSAPSLLVTSVRDLLSHHDLKNRLKANILMMEEATILSESGKENSLPPPSLPEDGVNKDSGAVILYTGSPSGRRQGVLLTHGNLIASTLALNALSGIDPAIREYVLLPMDETFASGRCRSIFFAGGTLVMKNGMLNPSQIARTVEEHCCNALAITPAPLFSLFDSIEALLRQIGSQIKFVDLAGPIIPERHREKLLKLFPQAHICLHYDLPEALHSTVIDLRESRGNPDSAGIPAPGVEIRILDDENHPHDPMLPGEISIRGPHVTKGYWNNLALTQSTLSVDGWLRSGDFGYRNADGYLFITGRRDDVITIGSTKFSPLEVEALLHDVYPDIELYVVGLPDPSGGLGDIPVLCYVGGGKSLNASDLSQSLARKIDEVKIPRILYRLEALPVTDRKNIRRELRRQILERFHHSMSEAS